MKVYVLTVNDPVAFSFDPIKIVRSFDLLVFFVADRRVTKLKGKLKEFSHGISTSCKIIFKLKKLNLKIVFW